MASTIGRSRAATKPAGDGDSATERTQAKEIAFATEHIQRRAEQQREAKRIAAQAKRAAEREVHLEEKRLIWRIERNRLEHARIDSTAATRAHDRQQRRQQDNAIARMRADELRVEAYRNDNRFRLLLLPCIYVGVFGIAYGLATHNLTQEQLQTGCGAIGLLIFALLRDRFGLSLKVPLRTQLGLWLQRRLRRHANLEDLERILTHEVRAKSPDA